MMKLKKWLLQTDLFLNAHRRSVHLVFCGLAALALLGQFCTVAAVLFNRSESRAITSITDDDSNSGIETAEKTWFINDNGNRTYTPLYYRLSVIMRYFDINKYSDYGYDDQGFKERSIYFHLMLLSLLGIFVGSFLIVWLLTEDWFWRILGTVILSAGFLKNDVRSWILFIAKPDYVAAAIFSLMTIGILFWLLKKVSTKWLAFFYGLALSAKLIAVYFIPGLFVYVFAKEKRQALKPLWFFTKWVALFYFVIGFPQHFDVPGNLSFLMKINSFTSLVDYDFFVDKWLRLFALDLQWPVLGLFFVAFFAPIRRLEIDKKSLGALTFISLSGVFFLVIKKTSGMYQWYTFPFTNSLLVVLAASLIFVLSRPRVQIFFRWKQSLYLPVLGLALAPQLFEILPMNIWNHYKAWGQCRTEGKDFQKVVDEKAKNGKVLSDPYVPYSRVFHDKSVIMAYDMKISFLKDLKPDYVALKNTYYESYLPKSEGGTEAHYTHVTDIEANRDFYRVFHRKSEGQDRFGQSWKKIYGDGCGFELWEKL